MTIRTLIVAAIASLSTVGTGFGQVSFEFTNSGQALGSNYSYSIAFGDLDGDGDLDAMVGNWSQSNTVWLGDGTGTFTDSGQALGNSKSRSVALGDLDGDGDLDAMVANSQQPNTVWLGDGTGTFTDSGLALGNSNSRSVALGDLDGDGDLDAMVANSGQPNTVWLNDGTGTFTDSGSALGSNQSLSVALGDLNGDGDLDAMVANCCDQPNIVWLGDGSGTFTDSGSALGNSDSTSVALGDFDGDGDLDAMVANYSTPNTVWLGDGTGTFTDSGSALGNGNSFSVALGDFDGDGDLDAMVANAAQSNNVWDNDASEVSAVLNQNTGVWYDSARKAIAAAAANDQLLVWGGAFNLSGVIDARELPLTFIARYPVVFGEDLMFLPADGTNFVDFESAAETGYSSSGRLIAPENGQLIFSTLELLDNSQLQQNGCSLLVNGPLTTTGGTTYLSGEILASNTSTGEGGVNRVAGDARVFSDYDNAGATIIQEGILYIYGNLVNTGTLTGEYNNGFAGGDAPEPGDGFSIGGSYTVGQDATLSMPNPVWWLRVGGDLDIAIDDPADFTMSEATIELNGLAPGNLQTLEALSADLGADEAGFASTNFPIGALRITSDSTTQVVNNHPNSTNDACEAIYVNTLVVAAGGELITNGCPVYAREAIIKGELDGDVIIIGESCQGDEDGDGTVDVLDLLAVISAWGDCDEDCSADFDSNGTVDVIDLLIVIQYWGDCGE